MKGFSCNPIMALIVTITVLQGIILKKQHLYQRTHIRTPFMKNQ